MSASSVVGPCDIERGAKRLDRARLGQAGQALDQQLAVGEQAEAVAVLSDITRLKQQQAELEQLLRDRELMFSLSEVGIASVRDGRIQRVETNTHKLTPSELSW